MENKLGRTMILGLSAAVVVASAALSTSAQAQGIEIQKNIVPNHVFTPTGFDSNDEVQFVIQGYYPSTCYHTSTLSTKVDQQKKIITVSNKANFVIKGLCADMLVFYQRTVEVGVLPKGSYDLQFEDEGGSTRALTKLNVAEATGPNVDQYLYAPVQAASVRFNQGQGEVLTLSGQYTNSCVSYQETKVIQNEDDVIEILPIVKIDKRADCKQDHIPFHVDIPIQSRAKGETLIHIRALNGQAINVVHFFGAQKLQILN